MGIVQSAQRHYVFALLVIVTAPTAFASSCLERLPATLSVIETEVVGGLTNAQRGRLSKILVEYCDAGYMPGTSATRDQDRSIYTTKGLKRERVGNTDDDLNAIIAIELDDDDERRRPAD